MVVFGQSGFNRPRVVVIGQKLFYSGKWFYLGKGGCIREKVVLLGQKLLYSVKSGCLPANWL